jgi:hypothetical protein
MKIRGAATDLIWQKFRFLQRRHRRQSRRTILTSWANLTDGCTDRLYIASVAGGVAGRRPLRCVCDMIHYRLAPGGLWLDGAFSRAAPRRAE